MKPHYVTILFAAILTLQGYANSQYEYKIFKTKPIPQRTARLKKPDWINSSPSGLFIIEHGDGVLIVFDVKKNKIISTLKLIKPPKGKAKWSEKAGFVKLFLDLKGNRDIILPLKNN